MFDDNEQLGQKNITKGSTLIERKSRVPQLQGVQE
jgi:hypothetical protein